jgi:carbamoyltransferase
MELYIGTKFIGHDSSIFVIDPENKKIFGINEERLTRFKHDYIFPIKSIEKFISYNNINAKEVKKVFVSDSFLEHTTKVLPKLWNEEQLARRNFFKSSYLKEYLNSNQQFKQQSLVKKITKLFGDDNGRKVLYSQINTKILNQSYSMKEHIQKEFSVIFPNAEVIVDFYDHQLCHNISSYYSASFEKALLFSIDGKGDGSFSKVYIANNGALDEFSNSKFIKLNLNRGVETDWWNGSLGSFYTIFTWLLGFAPLADEGKVEALAAFGNPDNEIYYELLKTVKLNKETKALDIVKNEAERIFDYDNLKTYLDRFSKEDISAAIQKFLEDVVVEYVQFLVDATGINNICLSGGVAANVIMNLAIFEKISKNIFIVPAMGDDGTAQGAAILTLLNNGYTHDDIKWLKDDVMPYYGTSYIKQEVEAELKKHKNISYEDLGETWPEQTAQMLVDGKIGAIFHGRMEWGPRALGNRSIIADVRNKDIHTIINKEIKRRPLFQPFCPSILAEEKDRLFQDAYLNKHMTTAFRIKDEFREVIPGSVHVDGTARVQFVEQQDNPNYYRLIKKVKQLSGYGVVINTSFNKHGRTIVESPKDAVVDFIDTDMDYLVIEGFLVTRK